MSGDANPNDGLGYGVGFGYRGGRRQRRGRSSFGYRYGMAFRGPMRQQEQAQPRSQTEYLEQELRDMKARIAELEGKK